MFVHNLNKEQQSSLLYLAKILITIDEEQHEDELAMLGILIQQSEKGVTEKKVELEHLANLFDTEVAKSSLLLELIAVAQADGEYHPKEKDLIGDYAKNLAVEAGKLTKLEEWVGKQLALSSEVQSLLNNK